jgi:hypothetical protein
MTTRAHTYSRHLSPARRSTKSTPVVEWMEDRRLLAVTFAPLPTAADGSAGSLRAAIIQADVNHQDNTIVLAAGVYQLTLGNTAGAEDLAARGDLDVNDAGHTVTIRGAGPGVTIIDGGKLDRVFQIFSGTTVMLEGLTIQNGVAQDAAVPGTLPGQQPAVGGGILNAGTLTLDGVVITNCTAAAGAGKDGTPGNLTSPGGGGFSALGGGIYNTGTLTVFQSVITSDTAAGGKGGGGSSSGDPNATGGDGGAAFGGGIYNVGSLTVNESTISSNNAFGGFGGDGGIDAFGIGPTGGAGGRAYGGGLYVDHYAAQTILIDATVADNTVGGGFGGVGGVGGNAGNIITDPGESGGQGGGGDPASLGESAAAGAISLFNSTVAGNNAQGSQAGQGGPGGEGVPRGANGPAGLQGHGAGGGIWAPADPGTTGLLGSVSSIIAMNSTDTFSFPDVEAEFASASNTLVQVSDGATGPAIMAPSNLLDVDPKLGPLQNNGGPTPTMALAGDSPAIDAGSNPLGLTTDGRGFAPRAAGAGTDIGAFEFGATGPAPGPGGGGGGFVAPIAVAIVKFKGHKRVRVTDPATGALKFYVYPFGKAYRGSFQLQTGDVNGDGVADLIARRPLSRKKFLTKVYSGVNGTLLPVKIV